MIGRNDPCPCGSGLKYKKCCMSQPGGKKFSAKVVSGSTKSSSLMGRVKAANTPVPRPDFKITEHDYRLEK